jgi:hypothetical protein
VGQQALVEVGGAFATVAGDAEAELEATDHSFQDTVAPAGVDG